MLFSPNRPRIHAIAAHAHSVLLCSLLATMVCSEHVFAETEYFNLDGARYDGGFWPEPGIPGAQPFVLGDNNTVSSATLFLFRYGSPNGALHLDIYDDSGSATPGKSVGSLGSIPASDFESGSGMYTFDSLVSGLTPNAPHYLVLSMDGNWNNGNNIQWASPSPPPAAETNGAAESLAYSPSIMDWHTNKNLPEGGPPFSVWFYASVDAPFRGTPLPVGDTYTQNFDEALGIDGQSVGQPFPPGWAYFEEERFFSTNETTKAFPAGSSFGRETQVFNAGKQDDADRALALGITSSSEHPILQFVADVTESSASSFQLQFDVEAWDVAALRSADLPGEAAFEVALDVDTGDGFVELVDLGTVTTGATLLPTATAEFVNGNLAANRFSMYDTGLIDAAIPEGSRVRVRWTAGTDASTKGWVYGLDNVQFSLFGEPSITALLAGDADQDLDFDQLDLVQVQVAAKYLSGQAATWGEGDWNGAPGGAPGSPPTGDGVFDQFDIVAAQQAAIYLTGTYTAITSAGSEGDGQTSLVYDPGTGALAVDAPAGTELTSINIDSASGIFAGDAAANVGGSFDNDADGNIFKATFGSSFGSLSFGNVAQAGLSEEFVLGDLTVVGSLAGGGDLGDVDLVYVPEPATALLLALALAIGLLRFGRIDR